MYLYLCILYCRFCTMFQRTQLATAASGAPRSRPTSAHFPIFEVFQRDPSSIPGPVARAWKPCGLPDGFRFAERISSALRVHRQAVPRGPSPGFPPPRPVAGKRFAFPTTGPFRRDISMDFRGPKARNLCCRIPRALPSIAVLQGGLAPLLISACCRHPSDPPRGSGSDG